MRKKAFFNDTQCFKDNQMRVMITFLSLNEDIIVSKEVSSRMNNLG